MLQFDAALIQGEARRELLLTEAGADRLAHLAREAARPVPATGTTRRGGPAARLASVLYAAALRLDPALAAG